MALSIFLLYRCMQDRATPARSVPNHGHYEINVATCIYMISYKLQAIVDVTNIPSFWITLFLTFATLKRGMTVQKFKRPSYFLFVNENISAPEILILHISADFEKSKTQIFSNKHIFSQLIQFCVSNVPYIPPQSLKWLLVSDYNILDYLDG